MKIPRAYEIVENRLAASHTRTGRKIYGQLGGILADLRQRELSLAETAQVEEALDRLLDGTADDRELRKSSRKFRKQIESALSLIAEDHYTALGLCWGVASGAFLDSSLLAFFGTEGSLTSLGVGLGIIVGCLIGSQMDAEARRQNRVLNARRG